MSSAGSYSRVTSNDRRLLRKTWYGMDSGGDLCKSFVNISCTTSSLSKAWVQQRIEIWYTVLNGCVEMVCSCSKCLWLQIHWDYKVICFKFVESWTLQQRLPRYLGWFFCFSCCAVYCFPFRACGSWGSCVFYLFAIRTVVHNVCLSNLPFDLNRSMWFYLCRIHGLKCSL